MSEKISLTFLGDICLNDDYGLAVKQKVNPFIRVQELLSNSDMVIANLEAVSTGNEGENFAKQTRLRVEYENLSLLKFLHVGLLTLANNHVYDQLYDGFKKTVGYLDQEKTDYTGAYFKGDDEKVVYQKTVKGKRITFLNFVHPETNPLLPEDCSITVNIYEINKIISKIEEYRKSSDYIILLLHWGMDNSRFPEPWQRADARAFVKAGADLIIGHHSHVLQGYESIGKSLVFYSLGNFAFSRHFNNGKYNELSNRHRESVILHVNLFGTEIRFGLDPVNLNGIDVVPYKSNRIKRLSSLIPVMSSELIWPFYELYLGVVYKFYYYFFGNGRNPIQQLKAIDKKKINRMKQILGINK